VAAVTMTVLRIFIGPWPLYPRAIALVAIYGLFVSAGSRTQVVTDSLGEYLRAIWPQWVGVAIAAAVVGASLHLAGRALALLGERCRPETCRPAYLAAMLVAALASSLFIVSINQLTAGDELRAELPPFGLRLVLALPVVLIVIVVANGVLGAVRARLARQEELLAERLVEVRSERSLLLQAEEQVRAQVSQALHDDIQAALLRAVVRVEPLRDRLGDGDRLLFDASIAEIERVREERVRALGRSLAPNLADVGLPQALEELALPYTGVMKIDVEMTSSVRARFHPVGSPDQLALAVYRIAEQFVLNALKHGRSTWAHVRLEELADGRVRLTVDADGSPPSADAVPGAGSATINAWLDSVGGEWSIGPTDGAGTRTVAVVGRTVVGT
jgi:signal transduction histidine kinase